MIGFTDPQIRYGLSYYDYAMSFRLIAMEIDDSPDSIKKYYSLPAIQFLLNDRHSTTLQRTEYLEAFSYGDPGVLLASPGPSLSGLMLRELGTLVQQDNFYHLLQSEQMCTFFALTEPEKGSDASQIKTSLVKNSDHEHTTILNGEKCFCGNGAVAKMGVVLAKIGATPAGVRAVWLTPLLLQQKEIFRETLPMFSLRGAQIAFIQFKEAVIPDEFILGSHLPASQRGLVSIIKIFNQLRTGVGALAIGQAQAVYDLVFTLQKSFLSTQSNDFLKLNASLESARVLLRAAAKQVDDDPLQGNLVSLSKLQATHTAENVIRACIQQCRRDELIENPWLLKAYRDVFCWEYMEGTSQIQRNQIIRQKINSGTFRSARYDI